MEVIGEIGLEGGIVMVGPVGDNERVAFALDLVSTQIQGVDGAINRLRDTSDNEKRGRIREELNSAVSLLNERLQDLNKAVVSNESPVDKELVVSLKNKLTDIERIDGTFKDKRFQQTLSSGVSRFKRIFLSLFGMMTPKIKSKEFSKIVARQEIIAGTMEAVRTHEGSAPFGYAVGTARSVDRQMKAFMSHGRGMRSTYALIPADKPGKLEVIVVARDDKGKITSNRKTITVTQGGLSGGRLQGASTIQGVIGLLTNQGESAPASVSFAKTRVEQQLRQHYCPTMPLENPIDSTKVLEGVQPGSGPPFLLLPKENGIFSLLVRTKATVSKGLFSRSQEIDRVISLTVAVQDDGTIAVEGERQKFRGIEELLREKGYCGAAKEGIRPVCVRDEIDKIIKQSEPMRKESRAGGYSCKAEEEAEQLLKDGAMAFGKRGGAIVEEANGKLAFVYLEEDSIKKGFLTITGGKTPIEYEGRQYKTVQELFKAHNLETVKRADIDSRMAILDKVKELPFYSKDDLFETFDKIGAPVGAHACSIQQNDDTGQAFIHVVYVDNDGVQIKSVKLEDVNLGTVKATVSGAIDIPEDKRVRLGKVLEGSRGLAHEDLKQNLTSRTVKFDSHANAKAEEDRMKQAEGKCYMIRNSFAGRNADAWRNTPQQVLVVKGGESDNSTIEHYHVNVEGGKIAVNQYGREKQYFDSLQDVLNRFCPGARRHTPQVPVKPIVVEASEPSPPVSASSEVSQSSPSPSLAEPSARQTQALPPERPVSSAPTPPTAPPQASSVAQPSQPHIRPSRPPASPPQASSPQQSRRPVPPEPTLSTPPPRDTGPQASSVAATPSPIVRPASPPSTPRASSSAEIPEAVFQPPSEKYTITNKTQQAGRRLAQMCWLNKDKIRSFTKQDAEACLNYIFEGYHGARDAFVGVSLDQRGFKKRNKLQDMSKLGVPQTEATNFNKQSKAAMDGFLEMLNRLKGS